MTDINEMTETEITEMLEEAGSVTSEELASIQAHPQWDTFSPEFRDWVKSTAELLDD